MMELKLFSGSPTTVFSGDKKYDLADFTDYEILRGS